MITQIAHFLIIAMTTTEFRHGHVVQSFFPLFNLNENFGISKNNAAVQPSVPTMALHQ